MAIPVFNYVIIFLIITLIIIIFLKDKKKSTQGTEEYKQLKIIYDQNLKDKNLLEGRKSELESYIAKLDAQLVVKESTIRSLKNEVTKYDSEIQHLRQDTEKRIMELDNARKALEEERKRVIDNDRKAKQEEEENRDRIWAQHEQKSIAIMKEVCQKSNISLQNFNNTNLPDDFDTKLKPDFIARLLDQYVIFDPKLSKAQNLQTYIFNQVKITAKKIKNSSSFSDIYKTIFFVIPSIGLENIHQTYYYEEGFSFYIIPIEAFEPIISSLKRLEDYELTKEYDPQERENIVNLIASFDHHIRHQNATNILSTIRGLKVLSENQNMPEDIIQAVESRRQTIRTDSSGQNDLKKLINNPDEQIKQVTKIIAPKSPEIDEKELADSQELNP